MKKIVTVVGARPQFIKAAMVSPLLRKNNNEIIVHTGQHYDYNMSDMFFEQLGIPRPDYNLGISGGSHAQMTGKMMMAIEEVLLSENPAAVLLYGDTNSTLAAAIVAGKLHIPVLHIEAGTRTHSRTNPEEMNRICTDHIADYLFACTQESMNELKNEGLQDRSYLVGDLMFDAFVKYSKCLDKSNLNIVSLEGNKVFIASEYYYLTCHREENTDDIKLVEILKAMNELDNLTIYPVHPRNKDRVKRLQSKYNFEKILFVEPVGYLESIFLVNNACAVVTDSGGVQREAFFAKRKCLTVLDFPVWIETMVDGRNSLVKPEKRMIIEKLNEPQTIDESYMPFGDGHSAEKIVNIIDTLCDI